MLEQLWHCGAMLRCSILLACASCAIATPKAPPPSAPAIAAAVPPEPIVIDARFVPTIRDVAAHYLEWGRVDDAPRVAPAPCAAAQMPGARVAHVRQSIAADGPHGKKLYYLWANQRDGYLGAGPFTTGFAIVKQSFAAVPGEAKADDGGPIKTLVTETGEHLSVGARKDLFVMTKVAARDGADQGWIYGTVAVDGTITSAGRVASCMKCHDADAVHERLFGLAPAPKY